MADHLASSQIAVIGMAGRFPGSRDVTTFWKNLCDGVESIRFLTEEQLAGMGVAPALLTDPNYVRAAAALDDVELFDASFFDMTPREAEITDPQHRLLLECAWEAIENAGYDPGRYEGLIGVYAGATINTYLLLNLLSNAPLINSVDKLQINIGNAGDFLTTRISYKLNLKGPSHTIQSACSTSIVAIHTACQALLNEECDMAMAGGVSVNLSLRAGYTYQAGGITSPDGHCRAFDAKAQGTIFGSGVGLVVLKRLEDAVADRDTVLAVIKGSAINNDGSFKVGFTAPAVQGQAEVIAEALANAGVEPATISYVEAHGTGTPLGDPVEVAALAKAFGARSKRGRLCGLGSVKTNIGHLDAAAGVSGFIKTVLALKHRQLPPSLHFEEPNPEIDFEGSGFYVNTRLETWGREGECLRAGVSSFGVGGTNAHVIVEEAPAEEGSGESRQWQLLVLSGRSERALEESTGRLKNHLGEMKGEKLADVAYTLKVGRKVFSHRRAVICESAPDALRALESLDPDRVLTGFDEATGRSVAFMFPGQGAQSVNIARELYQLEPVFRHHIDIGAELLETHLGMDIRTVLFPSTDLEDRAANFINHTSITQPALLLVEHALARLWMSWGIRPTAMIGHSIGEYAAAVLAGVFRFEDALALVSVRGRLMQGLSPGAMLAVPMSEEEVRARAFENTSIAAVNAPSLCIVSGPGEVINDLEKNLSSEGLVCRRLNSARAFHSEMVSSVVEPFADAVRRFELGKPMIPFVSNVTGTWITPTQAADPNYWGLHLRQTVRFADGLGELLKDPGMLLLEVGPGATLAKLASRHPGMLARPRAIASLREGPLQGSELKGMLTSLGRMWLAGVSPAWDEFYAKERRRRVELPTYPFQKQRYWVEPGSTRSMVISGTAPATTGPCDLTGSSPAEDAAPVIPPRHPRPDLRTAFVNPASALERGIADVWERALGLEAVGINDNFFELGGDSLIAVQVASQLNRELKIDIPVVDLYEAPTIRDLARLADGKGAEEAAQRDLLVRDRADSAALRKTFQKRQRARRAQSGESNPKPDR
jgi:acyl transferase domain-containing protein/acyl carrier protein